MHAPYIVNSVIKGFWPCHEERRIKTITKIPHNHTQPLIGKLSCVIRKLKNRSVCMQRAFLLFCCCDEKSIVVDGYAHNVSFNMASIKRLLSEFGIQNRSG